jgi:hypothetical protein
LATLITSMNPFRFSLSTLLLTLLAAPAALAQEPATATTDPVGFVTVSVAAGSGSAKKPTLFSLPLLETESITGQVAGTITGVSTNSLSNSNAGWEPGALSNPTAPYLIMITSGAAQGRMFLIASSANTGGAIQGTANTATTVSVSSVDSVQTPDLTSLGINAGQDTYKIFACDTLGSFFGTPDSTGVQGSTVPASADTVVAIVNGSSSTYYFNTSSNRWVRAALGSPDASNVPLIPYYGVQYSRIAATPLSFVITGAVPTLPRKVAIKSSGTTILSQFWPADLTLGASGLKDVVNAGASAAAADTVVLTSAGSASTYFYNGSVWKRVVLGTPDADNALIPVGASIQINRKGSAAGYITLSQNVPYSLN